MVITVGCGNSTESLKGNEQSAEESTSQFSKKMTNENSKELIGTEISNKQSNQSKKSKMNLKQIKKGDYSSIQDDWTEVAVFVNKQDGNGSVWTVKNSDRLIVNENMIQNLVLGDSKVLTASGLSIENIDTPVKSNIEKGRLSITCITSNDIWTASFYPENVELDNLGVAPPSTVNNKKDRIVVGSKHYIQVFQRKENKLDPNVKSKINFEAIKTADFSSLVGKWKEVAYKERTEQNGETPFQTDKKVLTNDLTIEKSKIWTNRVSFDTSEITSDQHLKNTITQVYDTIGITGNECSVEIIPAGVEMSSNYGVLPDNIDINKDRISISWDGDGEYPIEIYQRE